MNMHKTIQNHLLVHTLLLLHFSDTFPSKATNSEVTLQQHVLPNEVTFNYTCSVKVQKKKLYLQEKYYWN